MCLCCRIQHQILQFDDEISTADVSNLSCKHKDLSQVIVVDGLEVLRDLSVPRNNVMKRNHITSESRRKHSPVTLDSSRKHNLITSKSSSSKHSNLTSKSSRKDSEITSESSKKHSGITSKLCRQRHCSVSVSSRRHCSRSSRRKGAAERRRLRNRRLSSRQLVSSLSSSQNNIVTRNGDLASVQQSPATNHSRRSSKANSANQSRKLSSSSSSSCAKTSAASGTKMECAVQNYCPLVIDATKIWKSKWTKTSNACSVLDAIMDETSECVETVRELDGYILKVPGRKRRHADSLAPQTVKAGGVSDTLAACIHKQKSSRQEDTAAAHKHQQKCLQHEDTPSTRVHKQKCLQHEDTPSTYVHKQKCSQLEDDTPSVISLGSDDDDDEVEIIDSDPKPRLGRSIQTDVDPKPQSGCSSFTDVVDTLHKKEPETVVIDLCSPSVNSKYPVQTQKYTDREDEKKSSSKYTWGKQAFKEYVSVLGDGFHASSNRPHDVPSVSSHTAEHGLLPLPYPASASSACDSTLNSSAEKMQDCEVIFISGGNGSDKMDSASVCGSSLQKHRHSDVRKRLQAIDNRMDQTSVPSSSAYGNNLYNPHPDTVRMGLRPIVIDGSNVAMG